MSAFKYSVNDAYPDLKGVLSYAGAIDTETMTVSMVANGQASGPFTGPVTRQGGVSLDANLSTFEWFFDVQSSDTSVLGSYKLCLKATHVDGSVETIVATTVVVENVCA